MINKNRNNNGQTVVIGALLMLAVFVAFISWVQITQFPEINREVESDIHEETLDDFIDLRNSINESSTDNVARDTQIKTKVSYPFQPARPFDRIGDFMFTEVESPANLNNAEQEIQFNEKTHFIDYNTNYIEKRNTNNITYNYNLIVDKTDNKSIEVGNQVLIQNDNIYLQMIEYDGSSNIQTEDPNIVVNSIEEYEQQIITSDSDNTTIKLVLKTSFDEDTWVEMLEDEDNVVDIDYDEEESDKYNEVTIHLDQDEDYTLFNSIVEIKI